METLIAVRSKRLGERGLERLTYGEPLTYELPDGYDVALFKGKFTPRYVCGKDGSIWELYRETKDFLVYTLVNIEYYTEAWVRLYILDHMYLVQAKKLIWETFYGDLPYKKVVDRIENNIHNNRLENLIEVERDD